MANFHYLVRKLYAVSIPTLNTPQVVEACTYGYTVTFLRPSHQVNMTVQTVLRCTIANAVLQSRAITTRALPQPLKIEKRYFSPFILKKQPDVKKQRQSRKSHERHLSLRL